MPTRSSATALAALVAAFVSAGGWYHAHELLRESRSQLAIATLVTVAGLLKDNETIMNELQAAPFADPDVGALASYLAKIRRDGVAKHTDMKQRLDQLAENNTAIATLS